MMDEHKAALEREAAEYARRIAVCDDCGDPAGSRLYAARLALVEAELGVKPARAEPAPERAAHPQAETRPRKAREKR